MQKLSIAISLLCLCFFTSCRSGKSDGSSAWFPSPEDKSKSSAEDTNTIDIDPKLGSINTEEKFVYEGSELVISDADKSQVTIVVDGVETKVFIASTEEYPDQESLFISFLPIDDAPKLVLVSGTKDLPLGSISDVGIISDDTGNEQVVFIKDGSMFSISHDDLEELLDDVLEDTVVLIDEDPVIAKDEEKVDISISADPITSSLPYILSFSKEEGLESNIDINVVGISQNVKFTTVFEIIQGPNCDGAIIAQAEVKGEENLSSYLFEKVQMLEGQHLYSLKRTIGGVSHCAEIARSYKRLTYKLDPVVFSVADHPFTQIEVLAKKLESANISLSYVLLFDNLEFSLIPEQGFKVTNLNPATNYNISIKVCEKNDPDVCLETKQLVYKTKDPELYLKAPILELKLNADSKRPVSKEGFAKKLYASIKNPIEFGEYSIHKNSCEEVGIADPTQLAIDDAQENVFYAKVILDGVSKCSQMYTYTHLGSFKIKNVEQNEVTLRSFSLAWDRADKIKHYILKLDDVVVARPQEHYYMFTDLAPGMKYKVSINAVDFDGNISADENTFTFKTLDYIPPKIEIYPPQILSPNNSVAGYSIGVANLVDIKILGLSNEYAEEVRLYAGVGCQNTPLAILQTSVLETEKVFFSIDAKDHIWSVERNLGGNSICSEEVVTYQKIEYSPENVPSVDNPTKRSLTLSFISILDTEIDNLIKFEFKKSKNGAGYDEKWTRVSSNPWVVKKLNVGTSYSFIARICDKHDICGEATLASEVVSTLPNPCKGLEGGEYIYVARLDDLELELSQELRERGALLNDVSAEGFCIMKYEAKNKDGMAYSQRASLPWTKITQDEAMLACKNLGDGYRLLTNAEWMHLALNIESHEKNWNQEKTKMNRGITDGISAYSGQHECIASSSSCELDEFGWHENRRSHYVNNGMDYPDNIVFDLSGNVYDLIIWAESKLTLNADEQLGIIDGYNEWATSLQETSVMKLSDVLPQNSYNGSFSPDVVTSSNLGQYVRNTAITSSAPRRGGAFSSGTTTGVFALSLYKNAQDSSNGVGFRCVKPL